MHSFSDDFIPDAPDLAELYASVGWTSYASNPQSLAKAIDGSSLVVSARDDAGALVGLARAVSDGETICYIQDILVRPSAQRTGIGRGLVQRILERYEAVRQIVLLTDDEEGQRLFYESLGFLETRDVTPHQLRAFVRLR